MPHWEFYPGWSPRAKGGDVSPSWSCHVANGSAHNDLSMGGLGKLNGKCKGKEWYHPKSSFPAKKNEGQPWIQNSQSLFNHAWVKCWRQIVNQEVQYKNNINIQSSLWYSMHCAMPLATKKHQQKHHTCGDAARCWLLWCDWRGTTTASFHS